MRKIRLKKKKIKRQLEKVGVLTVRSKIRLFKGVY